VTLAWLLLVSGSNWSACLSVAVLVSGLGLATRAVRIKVWATDGLTVPTVQMPAA
jgi:hypothetical protein